MVTFFNCSPGELCHFYRKNQKKNVEVLTYMKNNCIKVQKIEKCMLHALWSSASIMMLKRGKTWFSANSSEV